MASRNILIIGAGVSGLTTALLLSRQHPHHRILVCAKHMPGDYDIEYCSPWAGANYMPVSPKGSRAAQWDRDTWPPLEQLAQECPEAGVHFQDCTILNRAKDQGSATAKWFSELLSLEPWFKDVVPGFRVLEKAELPDGVTSATRFRSVCINTGIYLSWLVSQCLGNGVVFKRAVFRHISEAAMSNVHPGGRIDLVVNATGLGSLKLGGVEDQMVAPARGQVVIVRNGSSGMVDVSGTDDGADEACYIMTRAAGGGTVLGGSYQKGSWESRPDPSLALRIMKRAIDVDPSLVPDGKGVEGLDVIRHGVGLRPVREGGARVEKERVDGTWVVHNYGHGGAGYQSSYGCAMNAVSLVEEALRKIDSRARL